GNVPNLIDLPPGCRFSPRCSARDPFGVGELARDRHPELIELGGTHRVRCWIYQDVFGRATGADGPKPPVMEKVAEGVLTPAPTLPGEITVAETATEPAHAPYRRPTGTLPLVLGPDTVSPPPPDDTAGKPRP